MDGGLSRVDPSSHIPDPITIKQDAACYGANERPPPSQSLSRRELTGFVLPS